MKLWEGTDVPEAAVRLLALVREDGGVNMMDSRGAIQIAEGYAETAEDYAAIVWLQETSRRFGGNPRYAEALRLMGEARATGKIA